MSDSPRTKCCHCKCYKTDFPNGPDKQCSNCDAVMRKRWQTIQADPEKHRLYKLQKKASRIRARAKVNAERREAQSRMREVKVSVPPYVFGDDPEVDGPELADALRMNQAHDLYFKRMMSTTEIETALGLSGGKGWNQIHKTGSTMRKRSEATSAAMVKHWKRRRVAGAPASGVLSAEDLAMFGESA